MASRHPVQNLYPSGLQDARCARSSPLPILSVGRDAEILRRRERVLVSRSTLSIRSVNPKEAEATARSSAPHLWIFCSTIELPQLVYLACSVRRYCPASRLLLLQGSRPPGFEVSLFHQVLAPGEDTDVFLDTISRLALGF
jgi:hypothetical protein